MRVVNHWPSPRLQTQNYWNLLKNSLDNTSYCLWWHGALHANCHLTSCCKSTHWCCGAVHGSSTLGQFFNSRSLWQRSLNRGSAADCVLGVRVRIPPGAWILVCCWVLCVFRWRSLRRADFSPRSYSSTISLTSALDGGGWLTPRAGHFTPGKEPGWAPSPGLKGWKNLAPHWECFVCILLYFVLHSYLFPCLDCPAFYLLVFTFNINILASGGISFFVLFYSVPPFFILVVLYFCLFVCTYNTDFHASGGIRNRNRSDRPRTLAIDVSATGIGGIRSPYLPASSESLYQLRYFGPPCLLIIMWTVCTVNRYQHKLSCWDFSNFGAFECCLVHCYVTSDLCDEIRYFVFINLAENIRCCSR